MKDYRELTGREKELSTIVVIKSGDSKIEVPANTALTTNQVNDLLSMTRTAEWYGNTIVIEIATT